MFIFIINLSQAVYAFVSKSIAVSILARTFSILAQRKTQFRWEQVDAITLANDQLI